MFKDFCQQIETEVAFTSVYHSQTNRAVERANGLIFKAIKKNPQGQKERKMGGGHATSSIEP
jgi:hypothetical protein